MESFLRHRRTSNIAICNHDKLKTRHSLFRGFFDKDYSLILLCTTFLTLLHPSAACPTQCTCTGTTVDCSHQSLTSLPSGIPSDTTTLNLQNNQISTLTADMFAGLSNVDRLSLDSSRITTVESGAFNGLSALQELTLTSNQITSLPDGVFSTLGTTLISLSISGNQMATISSSTFSGLSALETLVLSGNQLTTLTANGFSDLSSLISLDLSSNRITSVQADSFQGLTSLPTINLDSNAITEISAGVLGPLTSLIKFSATGNQLTAIPSNLFVNHNSLEEIDLQDNHIDSISIDRFSSLSSIKTIKLRSNRITTVGSFSNQAFYNTKDTLENLDLSNNLLTEVADFQFLGMTKMITLDLSSNQITLVGRGFFANDVLNTINLRGNSITAVTASAFGLPSLVTVDLSYNSFTDIPSSGFQAASSTSLVENIYLNDNSITAVQANAFSNCPIVRNIDLKRNSISSLAENSFSALDQLRTVDLSSNLLASLPSNIFSDLSRLQSILLHSNQLETIGSSAFTNLPEMTSLDLSSNIIHTVERGAFNLLDSLATLNLQKNQLTEAPKGAIESITSLVTLDLSHNLIAGLSEAISFGSLTSLQSVFLHNNSLATLASDCFGGLTAIQNITLGRNSLASITGPLSSSSTLSSLTSIYFNDNSLSTISTDAFTGITALATLDLFSNSLTTLQSDVFEPFRTSISSLNLNGNSWTCDCNLQWLIDGYLSAITGGTCASPPSNANKPLVGSESITSEEFCSTVTEVQTTAEATTSTTELATTTTTTTEPTTMSAAVIIHTAPYTAEVEVGNNVELPCVATGIPTPSITWTNPLGSAVISGGNYNFNSITGTLIISGITDNFSGTYACTATNSIGDSASISVQVNVLFPPYITNYIGAAVVSDDVTSLSFPCDVNSFPTATIKWILPDQSEVTQASTGSALVTSTGTLHLSTPSSSNNGYYQCVAENSLGNATVRSFAFIYNSTNSGGAVSVSSSTGLALQLSCNDIYEPSGFAWTLPSSSTIITSTLLTDSEELNTVYSSSSGTVTNNDTSILGVYSVATSNGTLNIMIVTSNATGSPAGATVGTYSCYTSRGTVSYIVSELSEPTTATVTTVENSLLSTGGLTVSQITIYYLVLGSFLIIIILVFLYCYFRAKGTKKVQYQIDLVRSSVTP